MRLSFQGWIYTKNIHSFGRIRFKILGITLDKASELLLQRAQLKTKRGIAQLRANTHPKAYTPPFSTKRQLREILE